MTKENKSGIYCIKNKIDGKMYVGKGKDVLKRMKQKHVGSRYLSNAIEKYGVENFEFSILENCDIDKLNDREKFYIKELETIAPNGYNLTEGGDGVSNPSEESIERMRVSHLGKKLSKESIEKRSEKIRGTKYSENRKKNISKSHVGKKSIDSSSKYMGVTKVKYLDKYEYWMVRINIGLKKRKTIGYFEDEEDAAMAYDRYVLDNNLSNPLNFNKQTIGEK